MKALVLLALFMLSDPSALKLRQTLLVSLPGAPYGPLQASPDSVHVFSTARFNTPSTRFRKSRSLWALYRDGELVGNYDGDPPRVSYMPGSSVPGVDLQFSADGKHYAFVGTRHHEQFAVFDGVEGPHFTHVTQLHLDAAGDSVTYIGGRDHHWHLVENGQIGKTYPSVRILAVSPDGTQIAYTLSIGAVEQLFLNSTPQGELSRLHDPDHGFLIVDHALFSPDGRRFAYAVQSKQGSRVVHDGDSVGLYPGLGASLLFSPDSQHLAFVVESKTKAVSVVINGVEHPIAGEMAGYALSPVNPSDDTILWSPDSQHVAYVIKRDDQLHVVLDSVESPGYQRIAYHELQFLSDGRLAYSAFDGASWTTFIGAERIPKAQLAGISPDGVHRAFLLDNSETRLSVDGRTYDAPGPIQFSGFSPDATHFLYEHHATPPDDSDYSAVDGVKVQVGAAIFSQDEKHLAVVGKTKIWLDGAPLLLPDVNLSRCASPSLCFAFDGDDHFHAFATHGNRVIRIDGDL
jgi:hypothetical protein